MLESSRRFGVEIEFVAKDVASLKKIGNILPLTKDGSLRHLMSAAEYVSPILQGKKGANEIHRVCEVLKKHGASGTDPATSIHVHLDGGVERQITQHKVKGTNHSLAVSRRVLNEYGEDWVERFLNNSGGIPNGVYTATYGNLLYLSLAPLEREPRMNYRYFSMSTPERFKWLRNVLYFYTKYSDVMQVLVSKSRRSGNFFCIPLSASYDLESIEALKTMQSLRGYWYKGNESGQHYDDSRYHDVNLHSFWNRHGTVEIRSHGGTIDPDKILLWVSLHQRIVDKLEECELEDIKNLGSSTTVEGRCKEFIKFVDNELLTEYIKRLVGYYSNISIK